MAAPDRQAPRRDRPAAVLPGGRQHLLLGAYQTSQVEHEGNWLSLVLLAQAQPFAAREVSECLVRPWESAPKGDDKPSAVRPTIVQRDFGRILAQIGTPARAPKRRGKSPGRRERHPVLKATQQAA